MSSRPGLPDAHKLLELRALVAGLCDAELTSGQVARLEELICVDPACAAYYVSAMSVFATLPQHVGVGRGTSGIKLITEWQSRDSDFWDDVVKTAAALEEPAERSLTLPQRSSPAPKRRPQTQSAFAWMDRLSGLVGIQSRNAWITLIGLTGAAFAMLVVALIWTGKDQRVAPIAKNPATQAIYVARLSRLRQVEWGRGAAPLPIQSLLSAGQKLALSAGVIEVTFDSGAIAVVEGPGEFEVQSPMQGFLHRGRTIASVPPAARGFAIQTDDVRVVDLGTEFGVEIDEQHNASVHVLTGVVEAYLMAGGDFVEPVRIVANRAMRYDAVVKSLGQVPLERSRFVDICERLSLPVITAVAASSGKVYRIVSGGLREDALAYMDRDYEWNGLGSAGIPRELVGADYVITSNNDDLDPDFELQITVGEPATLYVLFDDRAKTPDWLRQDFVDTGEDIGLDTGSIPEELAKGAGQGIDVRFSVWRRPVEAGNTKLGATGQKNVAHYGVAAVTRAGDRQ